MDRYNNLIKTNILYGNNEENEVGRQIKYQGGSRVLVLYSKTSDKISNLIDKVKRSLRNSGLEIFEHLYIKDDVINCISDGIKLCKSENIDFVLIVGGASLFTAGKIIAVSSVYSGNLFEIFKNQHELELSLPVGIISTTVCGGIALDNYVTLHRKLDDNTRICHECRSDVLYPNFAIFSPQLCQYDAVSLEYSIVRIFVTICERFFSANKAQLLSENLSIEVLKTVIATYDRLKEKPNDADALSNLIFASINAHINPMYNITINSCTRTLANALISVFSISQEEANAILFPCWFTFVHTKRKDKLSKFGKGVFLLDGDDETVIIKQTVEKVREFFKSFNLPTKFSDIGADASDIDRILFKAGFPEITSIGTFEKLSKLDCEVLLSFAI